MVRRGSIESFFVFLVICLLFASPVLSADAGSQTPPRPPATASAHGIYLVFPFQNTGASSQLDWLSEGLEELTIQGLSSAGEQVYSHSGRLGELERYGIPASAKLSRATMLHVAEDLDADFVVFGSFNFDGKNLTVDSRLLRVNSVEIMRHVPRSSQHE